MVAPRKRAEAGATLMHMDQAVARNPRSVTQSNTAACGFSPAARLRSFVYAGRGIGILIGSQHNAWIHALATLSVVGLGLALGIPRLEWMALVIAIVSVWAAEAINTAFEFLCDVASPEFHPLVEAAKDVAAGAVLICAIGASITGLLVLGPPLAAVLFSS
jgi:diacylglycerol kinase